MDRALGALILVACAPSAQLADQIVAAVPSDGAFGDPARATDGVRGGGQWAGSLDVFSLGTTVDDALILSFSAPVRDEDGPDLAVFENPFDIQGGGRFFDPVVVEVSADCAEYFAFPFTYDGGEWTADPAQWHGFAGITPVLLHDDEHPVDPLTEDAGGDRFDLAEVGLEEVTCVRLTSATALGFPADPASNGPDIDGVYGR